MTNVIKSLVSKKKNRFIERIGEDDFNLDLTYISSKFSFYYRVRNTFNIKRFFFLATTLYPSNSNLK